jgi:hypothetical protein
LDDNSYSKALRSLHGLDQADRDPLNNIAIHSLNYNSTRNTSG